MTAKVQHQINESQYSSDGFIGKYQELVRKNMIPYQYEIMNDRVEGMEKSHVISNFVNAGKAVRGEDTGDGFYGMVFQDSDAGKWIEAAAYSLMNHPDPALEKEIDDLVDLIAAAQDTDGYLDSCFTIKDRDKRWTNLLEGHELYCNGHLIEGAVAYYEATGKDKFLHVMMKCVRHIHKRFVLKKTPGCPGHPEIELALLKLYRGTGMKEALELAEHFVDVRGVDPEYFAKERAGRDWTVWGSDGRDGDYQQSAKPVRQQSDATGHAVRAVYLYTAMADLASVTKDEELVEACHRLWKSITEKRMYVTGGIGSTVEGEALTVDYDLPSDTAYAETCASVGLMFFASRMLEMEADRKYSDVMELAFYNTVLAGMQLDGKRYFYVNPLESIPGVNGKIKTHRHSLTRRPGWYACACCPPNAARLISSFGKYAYGENEKTAFCHMFGAGRIRFENGTSIKCETQYPYGFTVRYLVEKANDGAELAIRIPAWSHKTKINVNGRQFKEDEIAQCSQAGYIYLQIKSGDKIELTLDDTIRVLRANPAVARLSGQAAIKRGALVYCFEGADNEGDVLGLSLLKNKAGKYELHAEQFDEDLLGGTIKISASAIRTTAIGGDLYFEDGMDTNNLVKCRVFASAVPYYTWCNREENQMRVFLSVEKE